MTIPDLVLSTLSTTVLLSLLAWFSRQIIVTRLRASVQHEFDEKLEMLRADLRRSEESFKADLRSKEAQIETLRSGALSGLVSRQAALDKRRLEAVDQLWAGIEALGPLKLAAAVMAGVKFEKSLKLASEDPKVRDLFATFGGNVDPKAILKIDVHKSRPFVSEIAWALFSAYQAIVGHATAQLQMLKVGLDAPEILDSDHVSKLAKVALPHYAAYIDKHGAAGYSNMLEPLEAELLKELQRMMRGEESDKASIKQAAEIMKEITSVNEVISKGSAS